MPTARRPTARRRPAPLPARLLAPLHDAATYLRYVHLLLGAVLLLPYLALGWLLATSARGGGMDPVALALLLVPAVGGGIAVTLIPGVRTLEVAAARALLGIRLPDPDPATAAWWPVRRRSLGYLVAAMLLGGLAALATLIAIPSAVGFLVAPWRPVSSLPTGPSAWWTPPVGVLIVLALIYLVAALGAALARLAIAALAPTRPERLAAELAAAQRTAHQLAERNRLARELHDSVGHALTVTTLQAEAARRMLGTASDSGIQSAGRALETIAEAGRTALAELDHVLGVLREGTAEPVDRLARPDLSALPTLVAGARSAGTDVTVTTHGSLVTVPPTVSREGYRIVQEALTNALRHAGDVPVQVRVEVDEEALTVRVSNPAPAGRGAGHRTSAVRGAGHRTSAVRGAGHPTPAVRGGGRGLSGMAERATLLGGELVAGEHDGHWRVLARLPLDPAAVPAAPTQQIPPPLKVAPHQDHLPGHDAPRSGDLPRPRNTPPRAVAKGRPS